MDDKTLIRGILEDKPGVLEFIYKENRDDFINWAIRRYSCQIEDAKEIFQLAVILLYENIKNDRMKELTSSLKTYLFAIGRNKLLENHRESKFLTGLDPFIHGFGIKEEASGFSEEQYLQVDKALKTLGQGCQELLVGFYYQRISLRDLTIKLGYKTEQSTKNQKYKCLQRLRAMVFNGTQN